MVQNRSGNPNAELRSRTNLTLIPSAISIYFSPPGKSRCVPCFAWFLCVAGSVMSRACEVCGKSPQVGNMVETRGKAKYLGGVGTKITGITRRRFMPNLQTIKVALPSGEVRTQRVCTQCIRSGRIRKAVRNKPFSLPS